MNEKEKLFFVSFVKWLVNTGLTGEAPGVVDEPERRFAPTICPAISP